MQSAVGAGECLYENFKLQYQVVKLEFIKGKSLKIEAVCYNPYSFDKEAVLKLETNNLRSSDKRLDIATSIVNSLIKNLNLDQDKLRKLTVRDNKAFHISVV